MSLMTSFRKMLVAGQQALLFIIFAARMQARFKCCPLQTGQVLSSICRQSRS